MAAELLFPRSPPVPPSKAPVVANIFDEETDGAADDDVEDSHSLDDAVASLGKRDRRVGNQATRKDASLSALKHVIDTIESNDDTVDIKDVPMINPAYAAAMITPFLSAVKFDIDQMLDILSHLGQSKSSVESFLKSRAASDTNRLDSKGVPFRAQAASSVVSAILAGARATGGKLVALLTDADNIHVWAAQGIRRVYKAKQEKDEAKEGKARHKAKKSKVVKEDDADSFFDDDEPLDSLPLPKVMPKVTGEAKSMTSSELSSLTRDVMMAVMGVFAARGFPCPKCGHSKQ
jgi:hypothetical protein